MKLTDIAKFVQGSPIIGALATTNGDCDYVSLKGYERCTIFITVDNATTVTGGVFTLKQDTTVAGTGEKPLEFSKMYANIDTGASDTLVETAVVNNTFTSDTTDNKNLMYVIEVNADDLDVAGGFDCVRVDVLSMASAVGQVSYILSGARYASPLAIPAITN